MSDSAKSDAAKTPTTFADLGKTLYSRLAQRGVAINYQFDAMTVEVPKGTGNAPRTTWVINGSTRVSANKPNSATPANTAPALEVPLHIAANIAIEVDGQRAQVEGSGSTLRLKLSKPHMLRKFFDIALPDVSVFGVTPAANASSQPSFSLIPMLLSQIGLTLEIADSKGPLIILGKAADGKRYTLPGIGTLENVKLASASAVFRLMFNG
jgi:hypothetical protein